MLTIFDPIFTDVFFSVLSCHLSVHLSKLAVGSTSLLSGFAFASVSLRDFSLQCLYNFRSCRSCFRDLQELAGTMVEQF